MERPHSNDPKTAVPEATVAENAWVFAVIHSHN